MNEHEINERRRVLQQVAASRFRHHVSSDTCLTTADLRLEAALRVWLTTLDLTCQCPPAIASDRVLESVAADCDAEYGEFDWWLWPTYSTCSECKDKESCACSACHLIGDFCWFSEAWYTAATRPESDSEWPEEQEEDTAVSAGAEKMKAL